MTNRKASFISAGQMRGARGILGWSQEDLSSASGLSVATIRKLEVGNISPRGDTTNSIRSAFENAGLEFIDTNGVRQRAEDTVIYQGLDGLHHFFDDVYLVAKKKGGEFLSVCMSEEPYVGPDGATVHIDRMSRIKDKVSVKCILTGDNPEIYCDAYCEYRWLSKHYVHSVPFYVYDDKYAFFVFEADPSPKIIVTQSTIMSQAFRKQFHSMWEKASPLNKTASMRTGIKKLRRK